MLSTLAGVVVGGIITVLGQVALDHTRERAGKMRRRAEVQAAVRVIRFHFYASQHVLKEALETGCWWSASAELELAGAGKDLRMLADLLPEKQWRIYTAAWRRLHDCIRLFETAQPSPGVHSRIESADLQQLLGAFVTVDDARHLLERYVVDRSTGVVQPGRICLTDGEITAALEHHTGHLVDVGPWRTRLRPAIGYQ